MAGGENLWEILVDYGYVGKQIWAINFFRVNK
jgi:hypothetical protein